ncbi:hypothetical protein LUZ60_008795 [Juncus effusus]|nr:hypothetical protein LUZ60_008795 [Juncus effusus]
MLKMPLQYMQHCIISLILLFILLRSIQTRARVPAIIVFGDSTVDAGNNDYILTLAKSDFEPYGRDFYGGQPTGRFCNGRLTTDFISEAFGLPPVIPAFLDPQYTIEQFALGVCFASASTGFDNATAGILSVISLSQQLEFYKQYQEMLRNFQGEVKAQETIKEALHVLSLGTNDFIENYYAIPGGRSKQFSISEYEDFLIEIAEGFIRDIYNLGARNLDVIGLIPFGCLPSQRATNQLQFGECNEEYNMVARDFNVKLQNLVNRLNYELSGVRIVFSSIYDLISAVVQNPSSYGFENAVTGCCGTGLIEAGPLCNSETSSTCPDAEKYVFWDSVHGTEKTYHIAADYLMKNALNVFL